MHNFDRAPLGTARHCRFSVDMGTDSQIIAHQAQNDSITAGNFDAIPRSSDPFRQRPRHDKLRRPGSSRANQLVSDFDRPGDLLADDRQLRPGRLVLLVLDNRTPGREQSGDEDHRDPDSQHVADHPGDAAVVRG